MIELTHFNVGILTGASKGDFLVKIDLVHPKFLVPMMLRDFLLLDMLIFERLQIAQKLFVTVLYTGACFTFNFQINYHSLLV